MLDPQDRRLFLEALRPPPGTTLDYAIGTTFSLDLMALLIAPLEFTILNWKDDDGLPTSDPLALLQALQRTSERIVVFCQAGAISVPRKQQLLLSFLEKTVVEVRPRRPGGVFHPKVWILRFVAPDQPVLYRLMVATRNLTFDRGWDTLLVLEGTLTQRKNGFSANQPLTDLVSSLAEMTRNLPDQVVTRLQQFGQELHRVAFNWPATTDPGTFHFLDGGRKNLPYFAPCSRSLTISPFLSEGALKSLTAGGGRHALISRFESLEKVDPEILSAFENIWVMDDQAHGEPEPDLLDTPGDEVSAEPGPVSFANLGLHAKTYIRENGWDAALYTGSANATDAGMRRNVEFMVGLFGKRSIVGVDAVLGQGAQGGLKIILKEYVPALPVEPDEDQDRCDQAVEDVRFDLAGAALRLDVQSDGSGERFDLELSGAVPDFPERVEVQCWPITLRQDQWARSLASEKTIFPGVSVEAVSSFVAFEVVAREGSTFSTVRFVLNVPLNGAPENRLSRITSTLLKDKSRFVKLILLLLAGDDAEARAALLGTGSLHGKARTGGHAAAQLPLLEPMIRALHADPTRLDHVGRLVDDLRKGGADLDLFPEGFAEVWEPIWQARRGLLPDESAKT